MRSRNVKKVFLQSAALLIGLSLLPSSKPEVYHNIWSTRWQKIPVIYTSLHYHIEKSHCQTTLIWNFTKSKASKANQVGNLSTTYPT